MPDNKSVTQDSTDVTTAPSLPAVEPVAGGVADAPAPSAGTPAPDNPAPSPVVEPDVPANPAVVAAPSTDDKKASAPVDAAEIPAEVARKIGESHNVLVALSSDPSVDEMAAAIGLSLYLDKLGKRATAIYSGQTPNALEFLKPEETFEPSVDTLQDFVIALNKEKADHLRYKLDGDYVKIYITPYKSKISEEDLDFSYGDYNVDLVLALDVANGVDLDAALREHGRIMHDAVIINITTGNPGKLGEIEWSDKTASSVSEMIARLLYSVSSKAKIEKDEATAFLTGIVAATNRFSNAGTTPETMKIASKLMESGANQQLVSKNITSDIENEMFSMPGVTRIGAEKVDSDPTKLDIAHGNEQNVDETKEVDDVVTEKESTLLDDLKAAEASLAGAGAEATPEASEEPLKIDSAEAEKPQEVTSGNDTAEASAEPEAGAVEANADSAAADTEKAETTSESGSGSGSESESGSGDAGAEDGGFISDKPEKVIQPLSDMGEGGFAGVEDSNKYGQMLEDALAGANEAPVMPGVGEPMTAPVAAPTPVATSVDNPAAMSAPAVMTNPEINGVPEINYMPMPGEEVLPPPPTPPIDMNTPAPEVAVTPEVATAPVEATTPAVTPTAGGVAETLGAQPAMQDQVYAPQVADPSAFKIPGM